MPHPLIELGGAPSAPLMHIALANGFVPQTYLPLLNHFADAYRLICLPPRALWGEGDPPPVTPTSNWDTMRDDLLAGMTAHNLQPMVAIGHSMGGVASLKTFMRHPEQFRALILLDPTILTPAICQMIEQARQAGMSHMHPLAQTAIRRRSQFDSPQDAFERFRTKPLFADWSDETLRLYAEYGTIPDGDGGVTLRWSGAWEAYYFSTGATEIWDILPDFERVVSASGVPVLIMNGGDSDTFLADSAEKVRQLVPGADYATIERHGHLFPHSAPDATANVIRTWLQDKMPTTF